MAGFFHFHFRLFTGTTPGCIGSIGGDDSCGSVRPCDWCNTAAGIEGSCCIRLVHLCISVVVEIWCIPADVERVAQWLLLKL